MASVDSKRAFNKLKHDLENWRELILLANSIFKWDQPYYPGLIFGSITTIFLFQWYLEYSTLTMLCLLALVLILFDYLYPIISKFIFKSENWTGIQESKFEQICNELCAFKMRMSSLFDIMFNAKEQKSTVFVIGISAALLFGAYIGSVIDNLFLTYITIISLALYPGLNKTGYISKVKERVGKLYKCNATQVKSD